MSLVSKRLVLSFGVALALSRLALAGCAEPKQKCTASGNKDAGEDVGGDAPRDSRVPPLSDGGGREVDAVACGTHCSADLHDILDCENHVLQTCLAAEGCGPDGTCVSACDSAAANTSTLGCDFYSVAPGTDTVTGGQTDGSCFAAYVANTWNAPVALTVEYAGAALPLAGMAVIPTGSGASLTYSPLPGGMLPPGELAILFLNDWTEGAGPTTFHCPPGITAGVTSIPTSSETTGIINAAFHITSSAPVSAYDIFPYGGATSYVTSATLLIPTSAWGMNYLAVDSFATTVLNDFTDAQPFIQITASQNGTSVELSPTAAIVGGMGVPASGQGSPSIYNLNAGEVLQLKQAEELNGTPIKSNKPIGVWGGNSCMNIDPDDEACDSGHQQLFPIGALGSEYVAVRYRPRLATLPNEAPPWRVMGVVDGTVLSYEPAPPPGAPTKIDSGELVMFYSPGPFVVNSQDINHPFYVAAHMGGWDFQGVNYDNLGDPEHVNVIPPQQYLSRYIFMTDPTFANTNLVLVRGKSSAGTFADVTLDCLPGPVSGWTSIGTTGTYEYAWVDLVRGGAAQGACNNGYHAMSSTSPFGLTVWGWDQAVSYAYPAGARVQRVNSVVVSPLPK